jgi:MFS superfamily sulfate permease-like transporter
MKLSLSFKNISSDIPAGLVVFFVALPLCLGVAMASNAPLFAGIIAGICGGIIVGLCSGSSLGVSGPAAGLTVIVATAIASAGDYKSFLLSVVLAGCIQIIMGVVGAGKIAYFFPSSVIKGMLSAIGIIIIMKQIPHAFGLDKDEEGDFSFLQHDGENTFSELFNIANYTTEGALIIGVFSLAFLLLYDRISKKIPFLKLVPGALLCVVFSILINKFYPENLKLGSEHLVKLPVADSIGSFVNFFQFPNFSAIGNGAVWRSALVIAIIASLETLLCVEATDKLDPERSITPTNQELIAQGIGNIASGLIGGIPVTQVIVRSSANIQSGGKSSLSTVFHGLLLLFCAIFIPNILNMIPLACLAAVLILVGYKLASPAIFKKAWHDGINQFLPFIITVIAIVFTDLLTGILIGLAVGLCFVIYTNFKTNLKIKTKGNETEIRFKKDTFFFNKYELNKALSNIPKDHKVIFNGEKAEFIDYDVFELIEDFEQDAKNNNISIEKIELAFEKTKHQTT